MLIGQDLLPINTLLQDVVLSRRKYFISWKSKKQNVVAWSTTKAEYRAMVSLTYGLLLVKQFLQELNFCEIQTNWRCILITKLLSTLLRIQYSMRELNTLKLTVIIFEKIELLVIVCSTFFVFVSDLIFVFRCTLVLVHVLPLSFLRFSFSLLKSGCCSSSLRWLQPALLLSFPLLLPVTLNKPK